MKLIALLLLSCIANAHEGGDSGGHHASPSMVFPVVVNSAPAAPSTCDADHVGYIVYADDTNDATGGRLCSCVSTAGGSHDWVDLTSVSLITGSSLPCPYF